MIANSELIINNRGGIYHLDIRPEELATIVILVGDPNRVYKVSNFFDKIESKQSHREFISHTGYFRHLRITVLSTGIGPDNIDIVMNELDALVNIDFTTRRIKPQLTSLKIIRMGTSGSLHTDIPVDSLVGSAYGIGFDNLLNFYNLKNNTNEEYLIESLKKHIGISTFNFYVAQGSVALLNLLSKEFIQGITVTSPGFYAPQGRILRLGLKYPKMNRVLSSFSSGKEKITNFEMETSAIYGLGKLLGHECMSINTIIANRIRKEFTLDMNRTVTNMIAKTLQQLLLID
ncbi:MAG: nucleoside phosphorylase [Chitinophagaceae bacterium]